jgi:hypothetical protein
MSEVIPAQPGFFVLTVAFGLTPDDPPDVSKEPVIAWKVSVNGGKLFPLCVDEAFDGSGEAEAWAILYPDGKVLDRDQEADFPSIDDWLLYHRHYYEVEFAKRVNPMDIEQELQELTDTAREGGMSLLDIIAALKAHVEQLLGEGALEEAAEHDDEPNGAPV